MNLPQDINNEFLDWYQERIPIFNRAQYFQIFHEFVSGKRITVTHPPMCDEHSRVVYIDNITIE